MNRKMLITWARNNRLLCVIIACGFLLRLTPILWGIQFASPMQVYHPDEPKVFSTIVNFPWVYFTTKPFPAYGTAVQYILGTILLPFKLILVKLYDNREMFNVLARIVSRLASVFLGTVAIYMTYRLAKNLLNEKAALLSAAFLATSFYHTLNSAVITVDVAMSLMLLLNFLLAFHAFERNDVQFYLLLGAATALLLGTKITGGTFIIIPFLLGAFKLFPLLSAKGIDKTQVRQQMRCLLVYVAATSVIFSLFHPHIYLNLNKYIGFYLTEKETWVDRRYAPLYTMLQIWFKNTNISVGAPVTLLALAGICMPGKHKLHQKSMVIVFIFFTYGIWRWFLLPRYTIAIAPFLCIFAAQTCSTALRAKSTIIKCVGMLCIVIALGFSIYLCCHGIRLRLTDTRAAAERYIEKHVPVHATIGLASQSEKYNWPFHSWRYPRIDAGKVQVVDFLEYPDVLLASSLDYKPVLETLQSDKLLPGYVLDKAYYKEWYRYSPPSSEIFEFYDELLLKQNTVYALIKTFAVNVNVPLEFPPPEIRIYQRRGME